MRYALPIVLLLAFVLRVIGTWTDLPFVYHWDEPTPVNVAVWMHTEGSLDPRFFHYPGGLLYLLAGEFGILRGLGQLFGVFPDAPSSLAWLSQGTPPRPSDGGIAYIFPTEGVSLLYLIGRIGNVILGTLTVLWVYQLVRDGALRGNRVGNADREASAGGAVHRAATTSRVERTPLLTSSMSSIALAVGAAFLLAISPLHARNSALLTTDAPCAAFLTWFLLELVRFRSPWRAGLALGLAAAFKYTGGIGLYLAPLGLLWIWLGRRSAPLDGMPTARAWIRFWVKASPVALLAFLVLNPYVLLSPGEFFSDFLYESRHMREGTGHFGSDIGASAGGITIVARTLWTGLGMLLLLGLLWALAETSRVFAGFDRARPARDTGAEQHSARLQTEGIDPWMSLLTVWCVLYLVQLSTWGTVYDRYLVPIWPALILVATWGGYRGIERVLRGRRFSTQRAVSTWQLGAFTAGILALPLVPSLVRSVSARMTPDPRTELAAWISREIDPAATIVVETNGPKIDASHRTLMRTDLLARRTAEQYRDEGARFLVSTGRERFLPVGAADSMRARQLSLMGAGEIVWREGSYWVLDLGPIETDWARIQFALDAGRFADAKAATSEMLRGDPSDGRAWHMRGDAFVGLGSADSAAVAYMRAAELRPNDPTPLYALGNVALRSADWKTAVLVFRQALERAPGDPVAPLNLSTAMMEEARALVEAGQRDEAASRVASALQYARAASVLAAGDADIAAQEARIRRMAERWGVPVR